MNARTMARVLAGVLGTAAAAAPAAAQTASQATEQVTAPAAGSAELRPIVTYRFGPRARDRTMPSTVVLSDSSGRFVASYYLANDTTAHRMGVIAHDGDLVLVGVTQRGVLEMVLENQVKGQDGGTFTGRWSRGDRESGLLFGRVRS